MNISKNKLRKLIKESFFKNMRRNLATTFNADFLRDQPREPIQIDDSFGLTSTGSKTKGSFYLYKINKPQAAYNSDGQLVKYSRFKFEKIAKLIGFIQFSETKKPCIPDTIQVKFSAIADDYQGQGYGSLLYGILFDHAKKNNLGVTSDHDVSTSDKAKKVWDSLEYTLGYAKRKTDFGNDTFDYTGSTPDPNDDCSFGVNIYKMATDHSWEVTHDKYSNIANILKINHKQYMDYLDEISQINADVSFKSYLRKQRSILFQAVV